MVMNTFPLNGGIWALQRVFTDKSDLNSFLIINYKKAVNSTASIDYDTSL